MRRTIVRTGVVITGLLIMIVCIFALWSLAEAEEAAPPMPAIPVDPSWSTSQEFAWELVFGEKADNAVTTRFKIRGVPKRTLTIATERDGAAPQSFPIEIKDSWNPFIWSADPRGPGQVTSVLVGDPLIAAARWDPSVCPASPRIKYSYDFYNTWWEVLVLSDFSPVYGTIDGWQHSYYSYTGDHLPTMRSNQPSEIVLSPDNPRATPDPRPCLTVTMTERIPRIPAP